MDKLTQRIEYHNLLADTILMGKKVYKDVDKHYIINLIEDHTRDLAEQAESLYEDLGADAVITWADGIGLRFSFCKECETETPVIGVTCGVCGCLKRGE